MPVQRTPTKTLRRSDGDVFAASLGLTGNPSMFESLKKALRQISLKLFDLTEPIPDQPKAMEEFVAEVEKRFSGYFSPKLSNYVDRRRCLEKYAKSYLEKSGKMTAVKCKDCSSPARGKTEKAAGGVKSSNAHSRWNRVESESESDEDEEVDQLAVTSPIANDNAQPVSQSIKSPRKQSPVPVKKEKEIESVTPKRPIPRPLFRKAGAEPSKAKAMQSKQKPAASSSSNSSSPSSGGSGPSKTFTQPDPPSPNPKQAASRPAHRTSPTPSIAATESAEMEAFLRGCEPGLAHRWPAFEKSGVTQVSQLNLMLGWGETRFRAFLLGQGLVGSVFEAEVVLVSAMVGRDSSTPAAA